MRALAEQATKGIVFATTERLEQWLAGSITRPDGLTPADLIVGQDLYILALDEPDYWWTGTEYQTLQTAKVDIAGYPSRQELTDGLDGKVDKAGASSTSTTTQYAYTSSTAAGGTQYKKPVSTSLTSGHIAMRSTSGNLPVPSSVSWTSNNAVGAAQVRAAIDSTSGGSISRNGTLNLNMENTIYEDDNIRIYNAAVSSSGTNRYVYISSKIGTKQFRSAVRRFADSSVSVDVDSNVVSAESASFNLQTRTIISTDCLCYIEGLYNIRITTLSSTVTANYNVLTYMLEIQPI